MYTEGDKLGRVRRLPGNLPDAVRAFEGSTVIRDGLGQPFVESETNLSLGNIGPVSRPIQMTERVEPVPFLGGLDHHYIQMA